MSDIQVNPNSKEKLGPWVIAGLGIIYSILPYDLIPDIPFVGWIDDFFILSSSILYLLESQTGKISRTLSETIRLLRIISVLLGIISIVLLLIFGTLLLSLFR